MKHFKTPSDFDSSVDFDAYVLSGVWKQTREDFASETEWQEYLREKDELATLSRSQLRHASSCALRG